MKFSARRIHGLESRSGVRTRSEPRLSLRGLRRSIPRRDNLSLYFARLNGMTFQTNGVSEPVHDRQAGIQLSFQDFERSSRYVAIKARMRMCG